METKNIEQRRETIDDLQAKISAMESNAPAETPEDPDAGYRYRFEFAVSPGHLATQARIKSLLKFAGRNLGMKCTRLRKVTSEASDPQRRIERKAA